MIVSPRHIRYWQISRILNSRFEPKTAGSCQPIYSVVLQYYRGIVSARALYDSLTDYMVDGCDIQPLDVSVIFDAVLRSFHDGRILKGVELYDYLVYCTTLYDVELDKTAMELTVSASLNDEENTFVSKVLIECYDRIKTHHVWLSNDVIDSFPEPAKGYYRLYRDK